MTGNEKNTTLLNKQILPCKYQAQLSVTCHFSIFSCSHTGSSELVFHDVLSGVKEMVAGEPVADSQRTHPLPPLGLYVTLYKAFLSVSQAWCVYSALGAYPWHWLFEPHRRSRAARLIGASGRNREGQTHYWFIRAPCVMAAVWRGLQGGTNLILSNVLMFRQLGIEEVCACLQR